MDALSAAAKLAPEIAARADEIEQARRLPADLAARLAEAGLMRTLLPKSLGGAELAPAEALAAIELVSEADASVGWCTMIASTTAVVGAYLARDVARTVYAKPTAITGGVFAPMGRAIAVGDGFRVSGRWQWASGSANCDWLMGGCVIVDGEKPRTLASGAVETRMLIFPATEATLADTWHVAGLCGTGSGEMQVGDLMVPKERSVSLATDAPVEAGPVYRFPVFGLLALGVASVLLGNARAAINDLLALATSKKPSGSAKTLAERAVVQSEVARAEGELRAARAFVRAEVEQAWRRACAGEALGEADRIGLRLAATHAARAAAAVTRSMYDLGGGSSVFLASPLQRRFRDAHVATQHLMVSPSTYELTGRLLLGQAADTALL